MVQCCLFQALQANNQAPAQTRMQAVALAVLLRQLTADQLSRLVRCCAIRCSLRPQECPLVRPALMPRPALRPRLNTIMEQTPSLTTKMQVTCMPHHLYMWVGHVCLLGSEPEDSAILALRAGPRLFLMCRVMVWPAQRPIVCTCKQLLLRTQR